MFSRMPVPVWDSDIMFETESLATDQTVSDDIWKKFELDPRLDLPLDLYQNEQLQHIDVHNQASSLQPAYYEVPAMMHFDKLNCQASREIRHHDCMWAGLCISKDHNRTHLAKRDNTLHRRIPAGRSLLIPKNQNLQSHQKSCVQSSQHSLTSSNVHSHSLATNTSTSGSGSGYHQSSCRTTTKNLESDGDSTRPETPQSSESETESDEEEEDDEDDDTPVFRHEQIQIDDIVSMPVSSPGEVTNQSLRPNYDRRKAEQIIAQEKSKETVIRNTLMSDHCYHLNQQPIKLEHLGVQTPSDSEEEIDVVSYEKSLPTYPSPADQQHFQLTVKTAFNERSHCNNNANIKNTTNNNSSIANGTATIPVTTSRPRGRPPTKPASRKRQLENAAAAVVSTTTTKASTAKRARHHRGYQRRGSPQKQAKSSPHSSPAKSSSSNSHHHNSNVSSSHASSSRSSSDDEPDTEKRSLHNNMERQRRIELRNAFEDLRVLVPEVEAKEKAPKVAILRQAASYCYRLSDNDRMNEAKVAELKRKQERLRAQLSQLRRSLAMQR